MSTNIPSNIAVFSPSVVPCGDGFNWYVLNDKSEVVRSGKTKTESAAWLKARYAAQQLISVSLGITFANNRHPNADAMASQIMKSLGIHLYQFGEETVLAASETEAVEFINVSSGDPEDDWYKKADDVWSDERLTDLIGSSENEENLTVIAAVVESYMRNQVPFYFCSTYA